MDRHLHPDTLGTPHPRSLQAPVPFGRRLKRIFFIFSISHPFPAASQSPSGFWPLGIQRNTGPTTQTVDHQIRQWLHFPTPQQHLRSGYPDMLLLNPCFIRPSREKRIMVMVPPIAFARKDFQVPGRVYRQLVTGSTAHTLFHLPRPSENLWVHGIPSTG